MILMETGQLQHRIHQQPHDKQSLYQKPHNSDIVEFLWEFHLSGVSIPMYTSNLRIKNFLIDQSRACSELSKS